MIGVHYTYAQVPAGAWLDQSMHFDRNHFDRLVHFSFGFLLAYPMEEAFRLLACARGWLLYYLPVMTILGLSGLWEIIESWVTRAIHPELGIAYLGSQGDPWDAQKDMAAALYGALLCMTLLFISRKWRGPSSATPAHDTAPITSDYHDSEGFLARPSHCEESIPAWIVCRVYFATRLACHRAR